LLAAAKTRNLKVQQIILHCNHPIS
jgi:hypothetical protein